VHLAATSAVESERLAALQRHFPTPPGRTRALCRAIVDGAVIHIADVARDPEYPQDHARAVGLASILVVPMLRESTPIGALGVSRSVPEPFSHNQITLLETFADQAVIAIENVRLLTDLQARTQELTRSVDQLTALGEVGRAMSSTLGLEGVGALAMAPA